MARRTSWPICAALGAGLVLGAAFERTSHVPAVAADPPPAAPPAGLIADVAALKAEVARLKGDVPDQSHAMADAAYHFDNLWAAARHGNWPLAKFYADETRSHLRWAVRIIPVRKDPAGREVDLPGMLAAFEQSTLKDLSAAVQARDAEQFAAAYKAQLECCMSCHRATGKEFIRLRAPDRPDAGLIDFAPPDAVPVPVAPK